ncbi:M4 family metallopeptidase [Nocardioides sp. GY 10127]|uniref:M4 family metallopeptidase n=1 Tax=Nocardioides sp. GY 10127 TaxID=2569762 RepID=UPI0010A94A73|nr:M4 family metallopeptidase [Nocardioides sp. GY 10127]TIC85452.1 hypothetical protein E8D37_02085 [Nocardioides sp. GY 10127]
MVDLAHRRASVRRLRRSLLVLAVALPGALAPTLVTAPAADAVGVAGTSARGSDDGVSVRREAGHVSVNVDADALLLAEDVDGDTQARSAARAYLDDYRPTVATPDLVPSSVRDAVSGVQVVRFDQEVDGVPVLGGGAVVRLREDGSLASLATDVSAETGLATARVGAREARRTAVVAGSRGAADVTAASSTGRVLLDPAVLDLPLPSARTAVAVEVDGTARDGSTLAQTIYVDDVTGAVLLRIDRFPSLNRVVCDNANGELTAEPVCTSGFARTETSGASGDDQVDTAFDLTGGVAGFYDEVGDLDLTSLLGQETDEGTALVSVVRACFSSLCPGVTYQNAYWSGSQMVYGDGYESADDVVGHEMTHGVVERYSNLVYYGQSGAINESMADVMGEIFDHRHASAGDSADSWTMGEDLPIGAIRDMSDPTIYGDPDSTQSSDYVLDEYDSGGVHLNSGVGNKTAYLISQGGTFRGQTVTGIDGSDADLTKTAVLYLDVIQSLSPASGFSALGDQLDQSCQDLVGTHGFTLDDCVAVHSATLATALGEEPAGVDPATHVEPVCTSGTKRVLLNAAKAADPGSLLSGQRWHFGTESTYGVPAATGQDAWYNTSTAADARSALTLSRTVSLPSGQKSYLWFHQWYVMDTYDDGSGADYYDVGLVDVVANGTRKRADTMSWVNGPDAVPHSSTGLGGRVAFGGHTEGWEASRLNLTSLAGKKVRPVFTYATDSIYTYIGWLLDDVTVYTCDVFHSPRPRISGSPVVGRRLTAKAGDWGGSTDLTYRWRRDGHAIAGATARTYRPVGKDVGHRLTVQVHGTDGTDAATRTSAATARVTR